MAISNLTYKSFISTRNISKSVSNLRDGIFKTQENAINMNSILSNSNKRKKNEISRNIINFSKKIERLKRKEKEDIVEASFLSRGIVRTGNAITNITSSAKGFLGRILDSVGIIIIGWMVNNLPTIINLSKILVDRIKKYVAIGSSAISGISEMMSGFGGVLGGIYSNIISFDFTDSQGKVSDSMDKLLGGFNKLQDSMFRFIDLFSGDLNKIFDLVVPTVKGIDIPDMPGTTSGETGGAPSGGSSSGGGGRWKPILDLVGSAEGGYDSVNFGSGPGRIPGLTKMTIRQAFNATEAYRARYGGSGAMGKYQIVDNPLGRAKSAGLNVDKDLFSVENQDKIGVYMIEKERKITPDLIKNNPVEAAKKLSQLFAGIPVLAPTYSDYAGRTVTRGESFYQGYGGNKATVTAAAVELAFKKFGSAPVPPAQPSRPSGSPTPPPTQIGRLRGGEKLTSKIGKGVEYVVITDVYKDPDRPTHKGIDIAAPAGTYIALRVDCRVVGTQTDGRYGYVIDVWVPQYNVQLRFAHCQSFIITSGKIPAGTSFARVGSTGYSSAPHIHFEYSTKYNDKTYGGSGDPSAYVGLILLTNKKSTASSTVPQVAKPAPAQINIESVGRDVATLQREKSSNIITVPLPQQPEVATIPLMMNNDPPFTPSEDNVNMFIIKKLLLDLAYT